MQEPAEASSSREEEEEEEDNDVGQYSEAPLIYYTMMPADDDCADLLDTSDPRDSTASPEELEDDDNSGDNDSVVTKTCTYQSCQETTSQVAKQRKPWMCKKHRNKMYKDKYKNKKKSDHGVTTTASKLEVSIGDTGRA